MTELSDKTLQAIEAGNTKVLESKPEWLSPPVLEFGKMLGFRYRYGMKWTATKPDGQVVFVREVHDLDKLPKRPTSERQARMILVEPIRELMTRLETYLNPKCLCSHDNPVLCPVDHERKG